MAKSSATCFNFISCASGCTGNDSGKDHGSESQEKDSKEKRRWSFRKRAAQHRVLSTTVEIEQSSSSKDKHENESVCDQNKQIMNESTGKSTHSALMDASTGKSTLSALMDASTGKSTLSALMDKPTESTETAVTFEAPETHVFADRSTEVSAVIDIQAAVRAYLACREFYRLKCIVSLQAHVRGNLVRKQAARTLRCAQAIVRLQALVRARRVRLSEEGLAIREKLEYIRQQNGSKGNVLERNGSNSSMNNNTFMSEKLFSNGFANQLLKAVPKTDSLCMEYDPDHCNSGWKWLERWMAASPWGSGLSVHTNNTSNCLNESEHAHILEARAENPGHILIKESNSMLGPVIDQPEVESDKTSVSLTEGSDLTSSPDSVSDQLDSKTNLSNSILDSLPDRPNEQLKQASNLVLSKDSVGAVDCNCSSREESTVILDYMSTSASVPSKHETNNEKGNDSLGNMQYSNYDSISNQLSIPLRNTSHKFMESVPSELNAEPDNPQFASRKLTNSTMDSLFDLPNIEGESCICDSRKASNSTLDSVSCQIEPVIENSMHLRRVSDSALDSVSEQLNMEIRDDSSSRMNSLDQLKDEAGKFYCNLSKVSNTTRDSVLGQHRIESKNPQSNLSVVSNPTSISVLDQTQVNVESPNFQLEKDLNVVSGSISVPIESEKSTHSFGKTLTSDMDCVLNHPKAEAQNSKCTLNSVVESVSVQPGNSSNTNLDSFSDQLQPQVEAENGNYSLEDDNCKLEKASNAAFDSTSLQVEAENGNYSLEDDNCKLEKASNAAFDSTSLQVEAENGNYSSEDDNCKLEKASNASFDSTSLQVEAENGNYSLEDDNCKLEKASNAVFDSTSLQVEAEKSTDRFRTLTFDMNSVSDQPKVEAESNTGTLSSFIDSVPVQPVTVLSSNLGSPSVQLEPQVEAENGDCSVDKLSNTAFDSIPSVQGTSPIHQSTSSSPASNKPENASAQQGVISSGDSIRTKHKRRLESPIKSSFENSAVSRRRSSSGSRKAGHSENESQGSPSLPNYMTATASAKAKSRAVNSQDSSPDVQEYGTERRRNSFPASNGNQHNGSPQTHRSSPQVQRTTKGNGVHSPRDSTEKLKQMEWRR